MPPLIPPPLGLYIHYPWCVRKCPYCDFNSHAVKDEPAERAYIQALLADLEQELPTIWGRKIHSLFIGGGTPSLLSPRALDDLLCGLRARLNIAPQAEITLEANPGASDMARFQEFRAVGVNRLSIGIQSFDVDALQKLGRIHDRKQAISAAEHAHAAGFDNFNLDLMFGLPKQTLIQALSDVDMAIALEPTHISYYQLTLEPNTLFYRQPPILPNDDTIADIQERGIQRLAEAGYQRYEISAYSRPDKHCNHNLNYWTFGDYLGIGPGAHGKITDGASSTIHRRWKHKHPERYINTRDFIAGKQELTTQDLPLEFMMNALRLPAGFQTRLFSERTGLPWENIQNAVDAAQAAELLEFGQDTLKPTDRGLQFLNNLLDYFIDPH